MTIRLRKNHERKNYKKTHGHNDHVPKCYWAQELTLNVSDSHFLDGNNDCCRKAETSDDDLFVTHSAPPFGNTKQ